MSIKTATLRMPQRRAYVSNTITRSAVQPRAKAPASKKSLALVLSIALLFILIAVGTWVSIQVYTTSKEVSKLNRKYNSLAAENQMLTAELTQLTDSQKLEEIGKKLGLHPPRKNQVIYLR